MQQQQQQQQQQPLQYIVRNVIEKSYYCWSCTSTTTLERLIGNKSPRQPYQVKNTLRREVAISQGK
jgi:hypothetical protein